MERGGEKWTSVVGRVVKGSSAYLNCPSTRPRRSTKVMRPELGVGESSFDESGYPGAVPEHVSSGQESWITAGITEKSFPNSVYKQGNITDPQIFWQQRSVPAGNITSSATECVWVSHYGPMRVVATRERGRPKMAGGVG